MAAEPTQQQTPDQYFKGIVKSVLDGGCVVIRGPPRNGPPAERVLALTNVDAPRLGHRGRALRVGGQGIFAQNGGWTFSNVPRGQPGYN